MQFSKINRVAIASAFAFGILMISGFLASEAKAGNEDTDFVCYDFFDNETGSWKTECISKEEFILTCGENPNDSNVEECKGTDLGKPSRHGAKGLASKPRRIRNIWILSRGNKADSTGQENHDAASVDEVQPHSSTGHKRIANRYRIAAHRRSTAHRARLRTTRHTRHRMRGIGKMIGSVYHGIGSHARPHRRHTQRKSLRRFRHARRFGRIRSLRNFGGRRRRLR